MKINDTSIPGLVYITGIPVITDKRGSFRTPFRSDVAPAFERFVNKQWNISWNKRGATRGIHAEPWDKYVHVVAGKAFAAIVDCSLGKTHGRVETFILDETNALFIPEGCGNSFQALEPTAYAYLTSKLWFPDVKYLAISLDDPELRIDWPIKGSERIISDKDRSLPTRHEIFGDRS